MCWYGWQGILIAILVGTGALSTGEDGSNLQNLLICLEMLPASIAMFYAFPYSEYTDGGTHQPHCMVKRTQAVSKLRHHHSNECHGGNAQYCCRVYVSRV